MEIPKSVRSAERAYIRFVNLTDKVVDIIWVNFTGSYVSYRILRGGDYVEINTYKRHPWLAIDHSTKDRLHIDKNFIYYPKTSREFLQERFVAREIPQDVPEFRQRAFITLPVYSLRYRSLIAIRDYFREPEECEVLRIPQVLIDDVKKAINQRNKTEIHPLHRIGE